MYSNISFPPVQMKKYHLRFPIHSDLLFCERTTILTCPRLQRAQDTGILSEICIFFCPRPKLIRQDAIGYMLSESSFHTLSVGICPNYTGWISS